jgi:hypothetical protein
MRRQWRALVKHCNTGSWPERASLRARRSAAIRVAPQGHFLRGVARLGKGLPFPAERAWRLAACYFVAGLVAKRKVQDQGEIVAI